MGHVTTLFPKGGLPGTFGIEAALGGAGERLGQGLCPWTPLGGDPPDPRDLKASEREGT